MSGMIINSKEVLNNEKFYMPIGSLYYNKNDITEEIEKNFIGKWERVKDVFILAVGDKYLENTEGGEATHKLTIDEMPSHNHKIDYKNAANEAKGYGLNQSIVFVDRVIVTGGGPSTYDTGGNQEHNNMPPYRTYYCWERVE